MCRAPHLLLTLVLLSPWSGGCIIVNDPEPSGESGAAEGGTQAADGTGSGACFEAPQCDPLSPACNDGKCVPNEGAFSCTPTTPGQQDAGEGEPCSGAASCQAGLVCLPGGGSCVGGAGCCVALCDVVQPQCGSGSTCMSYFSDTSPPCYEDVGICVAS